MIVGIVPVAGRGSRLGVTSPKALVMLQGRPLVSRVMDSLAPVVDEFILVARPGDEPLFDAALSEQVGATPLTYAVQHDAKGSAHAVAIGLRAASSAAMCLVVWGDQVGVSLRTVSTVARVLEESEGSIVVPLIEMDDPYVWFELADSTIVRVGRQRDGDVAPARGWADVGVFGLHRDAALAGLEQMKAVAGGGREQDFVYVLADLSHTCPMTTIEVTDSSEALAVNTAADLEHAARVLGACP